MNSKAKKISDHYILNSRQFFEQRLRLLQIRRVKPFSEPAVDLLQHLPGFFLLALALPQPRQVHHRPQLQRLRTLLAGNFDGLLKIPFSFFFDFFGLWTAAQAERRTRRRIWPEADFQSRNSHSGS